jgi:hypothetical protein
MILEPLDIKATFLASLGGCRQLYRHCQSPVDLHTNAGIEAAFLQFHKSWEVFLEDTMLSFLCGKQPLSGLPITPKFTVADFEDARNIFYQDKPYKEWTTKEEINKRFQIFFVTVNDTNRILDSLRPVQTTMDEIKFIRNSIAHSSFSTKEKISKLYQKKLGGNPVLSRPSEFLIKPDSQNAGSTFFDTYVNTIETTAISIIG